MPGMGNGDEVVSPPTNHTTPFPGEVAGLAGARPAPEAVLGWIARSGGKPWFPSQHAAATSMDRDTLDDPLNHLRLAGLIRVAAWERGVGQGYVLTPDGEIALATGRMIPGPRTEPIGTDAAVAAPVVTPLDDPPAASLGLDARPPLVVPILLTANLLWFFVGLVIVLRAGQPVWPYLSDGNAAVLHRVGAVTGLDLLHGEWWRLATACFVHIGGVHLLFNLFALIMVGPLAELLWGRSRLVVIYGLSGLAGSCLAMALKPESLLAGASGAIWGLLMSLVTWFMLFRPYLAPDVVVESTRRLMVVIVLNAMFSFMPGISWQAHLGGALGGFATAGLLNTMRFGNRRRRAAALALLILLCVGCIGGLLAVMRWSEQWAGFRQRAADDQQRQIIKTAAEQFEREVAPLLEQLKPTVVHPRLGIRFELEPAEISAQLSRTGARRNGARVAEARAKLTELKGIADAAAAHLEGPPIGVESIDRHRSQAKEFAEMRSRSYALLLAMLDSPTLPAEATWSAWLEASRTADILWLQITKR